ncbi:NPC intracellular cholesterol transporter 2-like [Colias croceus]|uniref:NPC intracellular cholesterol transporter 2-like n=1 Tax=Colias crocea TaxID=72248 RepID=UPI001E27F621|nr:NPC intracellular cholesterol transporter 2-like [Colias croceus]
MPCRVQLGEDAVINVVFESPRTIRSMKTVARASLGPLTINYTLGENEVTCNHLENTYCPLQKGEIVQYTLRMFIEPVFPTITVSVDFLVEDEDRIPLWCIRIRIQVVNSQVKRISNSSTPPASNSLILKYLNATNVAT